MAKFKLFQSKKLVLLFQTFPSTQTDNWNDTSNVGQGRGRTEDPAVDDVKWSRKEAMSFGGMRARSSLVQNRGGDDDRCTTPAQNEKARQFLPKGAEIFTEGTYVKRRRKTGPIAVKDFPLSAQQVLNRPDFSLSQFWREI